MVYGLRWEYFAVLKKAEIVSDSKYRVAESSREQTQAKIKDLCSRFPMP